MSKWQPIETAPDGETFLVWVEYRIASDLSGPIVARRKDGQIVCDWDDEELYFCTHWQPLPEPPK